MGVCELKIPVNGYPLTAPLQAIACTRAAACVAVGAYGKIVGTTDCARWTQERSGTDSTLSRVACPIPISCIAVGRLGMILGR